MRQFILLYMYIMEEYLTSWCYFCRNQCCNVMKILLWVAGFIDSIPVSVFKKLLLRQSSYVSWYTLWFPQRHNRCKHVWTAYSSYKIEQPRTCIPVSHCQLLFNKEQQVNLKSFHQLVGRSNENGHRWKYCVIWTEHRPVSKKVMERMYFFIRSLLKTLTENQELWL